MFEVICNNYPFKVEKIIKNEESTIGNVYDIFGFTDRYIMKVYDDKEHTISMIKIHEDLKRNGFNVPDIILNNNNIGYTFFDNKYYVVFSFLDGKQLGNVCKFIDKDMAFKIGKTIRKFHDFTSGNNIYNLDMVPFDVKFNNRCSALHFDLTKGNIFYNNLWNDCIGFIDFDDAKYGPSVCDVAIALCLLFISKSYGINYEGIKAFIDAYYKEDEKVVEIPYLREYAIKWIDYVLDNNEFDSSTKESFEIKKQLLANKNFMKLKG